MKTKVAFTDGYWTVFIEKKPVATFPSRKLAREYAREWHKANSVEELDKEIAQRIQH